MRLFSDSEGSVSSSDGSVTEEGAPSPDSVSLMAPPDCSDLSTIQAILTIAVWQDEDDKVAESLTRLANLCLENKHRNSSSANHRLAVHQTGGASIIAGVMRKWYHDERIQAEGCRALMNASYEEPALCESAELSGCQDIILGAMKNHAESFEVQRNGCGALANMYYYYFGDNHDNKRMVKADAIDKIVAAMKRFPYHTALQSHACLALWNLVKPEKLNALLVQSGARTVLAHALDTHQTETIDPNVLKIQTYAYLALRSLL